MVMVALADGTVLTGDAADTCWRSIVSARYASSPAASGESEASRSTNVGGLFVADHGDDDVAPRIEVVALP